MATTESRSAGASLEHLVEGLKPKARQIFARYRIPPADAEDLLQETFVVFLHKQETIRNYEAWLLGTLRKRCLVYWRTRRRRLYNAVDSAILESVAKAEGPAQEDADLASDLSCALNTLTSRCRSLLKLRYGLGCTPLEAAERMGYRRSGIYKVLERCLAALTTRLVASGLVTERKPA
jgi:RNA polymerase sigma factor (sigma-70 family)